jgi:hypothetical protein
MSLNHTGQHNPPRAPGFWTSRTGLVVAGFLLIGLFFLWSEHRAHLFGVLPYLLILACPLMHLFMHHGHQGHHHGDQPRKPDQGADS